MPPSSIVVGGGHNALAAAFYLARAGLRPLVLERAAEVGGGAATREIAPGFRAPIYTHDTSTLRADIAREMALDRHGVRWLEPASSRTAMTADRVLALRGGREHGYGQVAGGRDADARAYVRFGQALRAAASVLARLFDGPPPALAAPGARDLLAWIGIATRFRGLDRRDAYHLLKWAPAPIADVVEDWFEDELLRALVAARGLAGGRLGPRSAGSMLRLLLAEAHGLAGVPGTPADGPGGLTLAMAAAARHAGATIRTRAEVAGVLVNNEQARGVRLDSGELLQADLVVSSLDPRTTLLRLVDPGELDPEARARILHYRSEGTVAKLNLALSALPSFTAVGTRDLGETLAGRIHLGPSVNHLERAFDDVKYGRWSRVPWLEVTIPSIADPALAPKGAHVMSVYVHGAPHTLREGTWDVERERLLDAALATLDTAAPGVRALVVAAELMTPSDLERELGGAGGHIFHGELAPDQLLGMRPPLDCAAYRTPIRGLYLCGAGTHPGGFLSGQSGRLAAMEIVRDLRQRRRT
ncbi:MAG: NAD(P)/FAD-dependent oxidoreductase [Acidimicrobiia bacterium]|nr:NAD(P)/FAD-dependent oxidoreductase [Acidimicrobiia bacterium]